MFASFASLSDRVLGILHIYMTKRLAEYYRINSNYSISELTLYLRPGFIKRSYYIMFFGLQCDS